MSIEASYRRITPSEFAQLKDDPQAAASYFVTNFDDMEDLEESEEDRYLNIGTDWHALHFLLTGDGDLKPHPLPPPPLYGIRNGLTNMRCVFDKDTCLCMKKSADSGQVGHIVGMPVNHLIDLLAGSSQSGTATANTIPADN